MQPNEAFVESHTLVSAILGNISNVRKWQCYFIIHFTLKLFKFFLLILRKKITEKSIKYRDIQFLTENSNFVSNALNL